MPEGDSIFVLAAKLRPLVGKEVVAFGARKLSKMDCATLVGRTVVAVDARGKNLLIRLDDGRIIHIHLRMEGRLFFEKPRSTFWRPITTAPDLRLAVRGGPVVIGKSLPVLRILTAKQGERTEADLGPDLCREGWDEAEALKRLRALEDREIADALLVQRAVAGIGNIYKSEVLFLERVAPRTMLSAVADDALLAILRRASALLRANLRPGPRISRASLGSSKLWVYNRGGKPCWKCQTPIQRFMQGPSPGRSTYWCPECQATEKPATGSTG
jgi:endonuclease-8